MGKDSRIMVVDDHEELLDMLRAMLELEGFSVDTAKDGYAALGLLASNQPDLILLDLMMPGLDGFQVLRQVRQTSHVPVIMLTARCEAEYKARILNEGADDYITKPFMMRELIARIRARLRPAGALAPRP